MNHPKQYQLDVPELYSKGLIPLMVIKLLHYNPLLSKNEVLLALQALGVPWFDKAYETKLWEIVDAHCPIALSQTENRSLQDPSYLDPYHL